MKMRTRYMNKIKLGIFLLFSFTFSSFAQQYEIGLMGGGSKYIGDIGKEDYFLPSNFGGSLLFKSTINPWMYMRLSFSYMEISGDDSQSNSMGRRIRNYSFNGNIIEVNMGIEYNFLPRNPFKKTLKYNRLTPFMFSGISMVNYNGSITNNTNLTADYNGLSWGIPMILGIKYKISEHFLFTFESGARYTFTDNLDGTSKASKAYGFNFPGTTNVYSNDWYTFSSVGIIYTFGDLSCYFGF